jgi:hypothetical protein
LLRLVAGFNATQTIPSRWKRVFEIRLMAGTCWSGENSGVVITRLASLEVREMEEKFNSDLWYLTNL